MTDLPSAAAFALGLALGAGAVSGTAAADEFKLAVDDVEGMEQLQREWTPLRDKLEALTGHEFEFFAVSSRTAGAEALAAERVDFVLSGPSEYVVMQKRTNAVPVVGFSRPDYFTGIIVMADSGIDEPTDLKGRKVAFGDIGSTSSHIAPAKLLADAGLDVQADIEAIHTSESIQWEALKRGDIAAIGMNYMSDFLPLRAQDDLPPGAFRVIARGPDLPNDILMAGDHVPAEVVAEIKQVFAENGEALAAALVAPGGENEKYQGMKFLPQVQDSDYDYIREAYAAIGYPEFSEFLGE